jgi:hypothetical protein
VPMHKPSLSRTTNRRDRTVSINPLSELVSLIALLTGAFIITVALMGLNHVFVTIPQRHRERKGLPPRQPRRTIGGHPDGL